MSFSYAKTQDWNRRAVSGIEFNTITETHEVYPGDWKQDSVYTQKVIYLFVANGYIEL